jgi:hypothetical protein
MTTAGLNYKIAEDSSESIINDLFMYIYMRLD